MASDCIQHHLCADEIDTCLASQACLDTVSCYNTCDLDDATCREQCDLAFPDGAADASAAVRCIVCFCCVDCFDLGTTYDCWWL